MTIAACYVSSEGVVMGADSTSTVRVPGLPEQHYNHEQKVFEIGLGSTLAISMWGVGGLEALSYRTMIAKLADDLIGDPPESVEEVAKRWHARFWDAYRRCFGGLINRRHDLVRMTPRTEEEDRELARLEGLGGGFCLGGHIMTDRVPHAFEMSYGLGMVDELRPPTELRYDAPNFWGCPNLIKRLIYGVDETVFREILNSGKWNGTPEELIPDHFAWNLENTRLPATP